jgi:hypothetical protein
LPVKHWVDERGRLFCQTWEGHISREDVISFQAFVKRSPDLAAMDRLVDVSGITGSEITAQDLAAFAGDARERIRVAIVAPRPSAFGMARMYEIFAELHGSPRRIAVFQSTDEALGWLYGGLAQQSTA